VGGGRGGGRGGAPAHRHIRRRPGAYTPPLPPPATADDTPAIGRLIRGLAEYEKLAHQVTLDEARLREHLFGPRPFAEALLAEEGGQAVGFALFFPTYSTYSARPNLYLEDLFVRPEYRG